MWTEPRQTVGVSPYRAHLGPVGAWVRSRDQTQAVWVS
jgi:hypothetical protein